MSMRNYIKGEKFIKDFLPEIKAVKKKLSMKNSNGNPVDFTKKEKREIKKALLKMIRENDF